MPINSMNGDGGGFDFDLPPDMLPEKADLPPAPIDNAPADRVGQDIILSLEQLLGQQGIVDPEGLTWSDVPTAKPADGRDQTPSAANRA